MPSQHEALIDLVSAILTSQGLNPQSHVEYEHGELDILCNRIYYEVKSNMHPKNVRKALMQIERARRYKQCEDGYLVTYQGVLTLDDLKTWADK